MQKRDMIKGSLSTRTSRFLLFTKAIPSTPFNRSGKVRIRRELAKRQTPYPPKFCLSKFIFFSETVLTNSRNILLYSGTPEHSHNCPILPSGSWDPLDRGNTLLAIALRGKFPSRKIHVRTQFPHQSFSGTHSMTVPFTERFHQRVNGPQTVGIHRISETQ